METIWPPDLFTVYSQSFCRLFILFRRTCGMIWSQVETNLLSFSLFLKKDAGGSPPVSFFFCNESCIDNYGTSAIIAVNI